MNEQAIEKAIEVYLGPDCYTEADIEAVRPHLIEAIVVYLEVSGAERERNHLQARMREMEAERELMIHDLGRHVAIASQEANSRAEAEARLAERGEELARLREAALLLKSRIDKVEHRTHFHMPEFCAHCAADEYLRGVFK